MRLDKFLKVSRIIKRRSVANEACSADRVTINGKSAKPSKELAVGDIIGVRFGDKSAFFKVLILPKGNIGKDDAQTLYEPTEYKIDKYAKN
ncbi:MAG: RNA-binding S4 domain-containing protein [Clostridia bacterium]